MASLRPCVSSLRLDRPDSGSNVIPRRARPGLSRPHDATQLMIARYRDPGDRCVQRGDGPIARYRPRSLGVHSVSSERDLSIGAVGS